MLAFLSLSFLHLAIVVKSLDYQFFLFSGSSVLAEVFAEFIALNGDVVLLRLFTPAETVLLFAVGAIGLAVITAMDKGEAGDWFTSTWDFAKKILPLLCLNLYRERQEYLYRMRDI